jgi:phospholipid/cholesterol/gamma-HCH transport system substrate-binding protein
MRPGRRNEGASDAGCCFVMTREIREIVIGASAVLGLIMVLVVMNSRADPISAAPKQMIIQAKFNKVDGLADSAEVRMGGIAIGKVIGMRLDSKYRAVVSMRIDAPLELPTDSAASIHTDGLFGAKFVVLDPGAEDATMKPGDEITFTQDALVVSDLLELIISEGKSARAKKNGAKTATDSNTQGLTKTN